MSLDNEEEQGCELAGSMLVLMVCLLRRPSFTFPVSQYPTSHLSGARLYPIVLGCDRSFGDLKVMSVSCDSLSANRNLFHIGMDSALTRKLLYKTTETRQFIRLF